MSRDSSEDQTGIITESPSLFDKLSTDIGQNFANLRNKMNSDEEEKVHKKKRSKKKLKKPKKRQKENSYVRVEIDEEEALRNPDAPRPELPYPEVDCLTSNGNSLPNTPMVHPKPRGFRAPTSVLANTCRARTRACCTYNKFACVIFTWIFALAIFLAGVSYEDHHLQTGPPVVLNPDSDHHTNGGGSNQNWNDYSIRQQDIIVELRRLSGSLISEPDTPYHKAAHWMLWIDESGIRADSPFLWQRYVMALFYYKMGNENKFFKLNPKTSECLWDRITCDGNNFIQHLRFDHCDLRGPIPSKELLALDMLQYLDLTGNKLSGPIPAELQGLTKIEKLFLDDNQLEGQMPSEICSKETLKTLTSDCKEDSLKVFCSCCTNCPGVLPEDIESNQGILNKLRQLSGHDPIEDENTPHYKASRWIITYDQIITSANSPNLYQRYVLALLYFMMGDKKCFDLQTNQHECKWEGNPENGVTWERITCSNDQDLVYLKLSNCGLTGRLPYELEVFSSLHYLDLSANALTGVIPPTLTNIHNLDHLYLEENDLQGAVPDSICERKKGDFLNLFYVDCEPDNLKVQCQCCTNCLNDEDGPEDDSSGDGNHITPGLTERQLAILNKLKEFSSKVVVDSTPQHKAAHWMMKEDDIAADSDRLVQRYVINLLHEMGDGTCFERKSGVDVCDWLSKDSEGLSYSRIVCDGDNGSILDLQVDGCNIYGNIPVELKYFSESLQYLDLSNNNFEGVIPTHFFQHFASLRLLYLHNNKFTGTMPQDVCDKRSNSFLIKLTADCDSEDVIDADYMVECSCCTNCLSSPEPVNSEQLKETIQALSPDTINDTNSPQYLAMNWMLEKDKFHIAGSSINSSRLRERYVIVVIYFSLGGQDLEDSLILSPEESECAVPGVTCDEEGRVTKIDFAGKELDGRLPEEVHYLSELKHIDLSNNKIYGNLPGKWGGLSKLQYVDLQSNDVEGLFPPSLCNNQNQVSKMYKVDCSKVSCSCCSNCLEKR